MKAMLALSMKTQVGLPTSLSRAKAYPKRPIVVT